MVRVPSMLVLAGLAFGAAHLMADEPPQPRMADRRKGDIEIPIKQVVGQGSGQVPVLTTDVVARPADLGKTMIELPTQDIVKSVTGMADGFVNPKVQPGKVRWHPTLAAACAASKKSGKPVLLFQMMGKLDDQFC